MPEILKFTVKYHIRFNPKSCFLEHQCNKSGGRLPFRVNQQNSSEIKHTGVVHSYSPRKPEHH